MTFFMSVWMTLYSESNENCSPKCINLLQLFAIIFWVWFYLTFHIDFRSLNMLVFFMMTIVGIWCFLFFAPYLKQLVTGSGNNDIYYRYFYRISFVFFMAFFLGFVLFLLGFIGIGAIVELFDIWWKYNNILFEDWAIIALWCVTPLFALTQIPVQRDFSNSLFSVGNFFSFLIKYVAIPFIYVYFFILYAYSIKVLFNFDDWPKWEVCWLVIGFSLFWYIVYMFSQIFEDSYTFVQVFRKLFPFAVLPQVAMLFYAIFLRINQYDITVNRYFVVVFWIWLLSISLYFIFSKIKYIAYIPAVITLFTIIISLGPWSVYALPESRQLQRLKDNLTTANILQNWQIVPLQNPSDIAPKLSGDIYDGIFYVCGLSTCESIKELFPDQYQDVVDSWNDDDYMNSNTGPNKWEITDGITKYIWVYRYTPSPSGREYLSYNINYRDDITPLNIQWYNELLRVVVSSSYNQRENIEKYMRIDVDTKTLTLYNRETPLASQDISAIIDDIASKPPWDVPTDELMFDISGADFSGKLILQSISIPNPDFIWEKHNNTWGDGYFLLK